MLEAFQSNARYDVPIYVATNTFWEPLSVELPLLKDRRWYRVVDTSLPEGEDIVAEEDAYFLGEPLMKSNHGPRSSSWHVEPNGQDRRPTHRRVVSWMYNPD